MVGKIRIFFEISNLLKSYGLSIGVRLPVYTQ